MNRAYVVALNDDAAEAGAVVYWSLGGCPPLRAVRDALARAGVPEAELPGTPSPAVALHQATCEVFKGCLVRPLPKGGLAVVAERETEDGSLNHQVLWHFATVSDSETGVRVEERAEQAVEAVIEAGQRMVAAYAEACASCPASHLGDWLVRRVEVLSGVPLRRRGSVYYLPPEGVREYRRIWAELGQLRLTGEGDYSLFAIPALARSSEAVEAVLRAVVAEAEAEAASMEADLQNPLGKRALDNRVKRCEAVAAKVRSYEALLQRQAGAITERLGELQAQLSVALLTAPAKGAP